MFHRIFSQNADFEDSQANIKLSLLLSGEYCLYTGKKLASSCEKQEKIMLLYLYGSFIKQLHFLLYSRKSSLFPLQVSDLNQVFTKYFERLMLVVH